MAVNIKNYKCVNCKYSGIYLCTNARKCEDNDLYEKKE